MLYDGTMSLIFATALCGWCKVRCGSEVRAWLAGLCDSVDSHKWPLTPRGLKQVIRTALRLCPPKSTPSLSSSLYNRTAQTVSLNLPEFSQFFLSGCVAEISAYTPVSGSS